MVFGIRTRDEGLFQEIALNSLAGGFTPLLSAYCRLQGQWRWG